MPDQPITPPDQEARTVARPSGDRSVDPLDTEAESHALDALQAVLHHAFAQPARLLEALTHRSYMHEAGALGVTSNERLEFLGDAVLALISADFLSHLAPHANEGELTTMRAALVRGSALAAIARQIDLGEYLRLGRGEAATGGRERDLLLASALEAVLGALYVDGGLEAARAFLEPVLAPLAQHLITSDRIKDDKSLLQELAQAQLGITPTYHVVAAAGPSHQPHFSVEVRLGERVLARGEGRSKRQAEQDAAKQALADVGWLTTGAQTGAP